MVDAAETQGSAGRYTLFEELARGGMASVSLALHHGDRGFRRVVVIKRLLPHLESDGAMREMLLSEADVARSLRHPNVVAVLDVAWFGREPALVFEYVPGVSLEKLLNRARQRGEAVPPPIASALAIDLALGLHAAHEARGEGGRPLHLVHRDVSHGNVIVGADGSARLIDFGIAKHVLTTEQTATGVVKGKIGYLAPEVVATNVASPKSDIYGAGVVLWECLTGQRLFGNSSEMATFGEILEGRIDPPSTRGSSCSKPLDRVVLRALAKAPSARFESAEALALAIERAQRPASRLEVKGWVQSLFGEKLAAQAARIAQLEALDRDVSAPGRNPRASRWTVGETAGPEKEARPQQPSQPQLPAIPVASPSTGVTLTDAAASPAAAAHAAASARSGSRPDLYPDLPRVVTEADEHGPLAAPDTATTLTRPTQPSLSELAQSVAAATSTPIDAAPLPVAPPVIPSAPPIPTALSFGPRGDGARPSAFGASSVTKPSIRRARAARARQVAFAGGIAMLGLATIGALALSRKSAPAETPLSSVPTFQDAAQFVATAAESPATAPAPIEAPTVASATMSPPPQSSSPAPEPPPEQTTRAPTRSIATPRKSKQCNPPYTIGPDGIRRVKRECL